MRHQGFSLFEIAICLLIISVAVLSVVLLLPAGIRVQQQMRYAFYASAKALEVVDAFAQQSGRLTGAMRLEVSVNETDPTKDSPIVAERLRSQAVFGKAMAPDIEQVIATGSLGLLPLPMTLARRLSSDNDEIQRLLDQGGALYYCDPLVGRGQDGGMTGSSFGTGLEQSNVQPPELQRLVVGVAGYPQHNALLNHPMGSWPIYEMYPFPPQGPLRGQVYDYKITNNPWVGPPPASTYYSLILPAVGTGSGSNYQHENWKYMAWKFPSSNWANGLSAFTDLCSWGWAPIQFKIGTGGGSLGSCQGPDYLNTDPRYPYKPSPPGHGRGTAIDDPAGGYYPQYHDPLLTDPQYSEAKGLMSPYDVIAERAYALPSLALRRYYLRLALRLWDKVGGGGDPTAGTIAPPLPWQRDDAARLLALSYVAHAAVMCTGYRRPLINDGYTNQVDAVGASNWDDSWDGNSNDDYSNFPADIDLSATDTKYKGPYADAGDYDRARNAHENCLRWAMAYAGEAPMDMLAPRPANRMTMLDKPLYAFDLFDAAGSARRANSAAGTNAEPFYAVVGARPFLPSPQVGVGYASFDKLLARFTSVDNGRCRLTQPFTPSERTRLLVFWAVDWQSYEDFEMAPTAPLDESSYRIRNGSGDMQVQNPEGRLVWNGPDRVVRSMAYTAKNITTPLEVVPPGWPAAGPYVFNSNTVMGQWGADRNGNARFDRGPVPAGIRLRAETVARFPVYDPVLRTALRN